MNPAATHLLPGRHPPPFCPAQRRASFFPTTMPRPRKTIVLDYPWPFPLMGVTGHPQLLRVVVKLKKPRRRPLRRVPPSSQWQQATLI